jgi:hypothetical protein
MSGTIKGNLSPEWKDVDTCRAHCKGFKYFGLSNGRYCNCANAFSDPDALEIRVAESSCEFIIPVDLQNRLSTLPVRPSEVRSQSSSDLWRRCPRDLL